MACDLTSMLSSAASARQSDHYLSVFVVDLEMLPALLRCSGQLAGNGFVGSGRLRGDHCSGVVLSLTKVPLTRHAGLTPFPAWCGHAE